MSLFPETIALSLAGAKVQCAWLVDFAFTTERVRLWQGFGPLDTADGNRWNGLGALGSVSGIEQAVNGQAPRARFTLSGIDGQIMRLARDEYVAEVKGRIATVLIQFFGTDDITDPDNQRVLDAPYPLWSGRCMTPSFGLGEDGERSVTIEAESLFSMRSRPAYAMYTDADQQRRFPGDKGFEFAGTLVNKEVTWPDY